MLMEISKRENSNQMMKYDNNVLYSYIVHLIVSKPLYINSLMFYINSSLQP